MGMGSHALDPIDCSRCKQSVPMDAQNRPQWVTSTLHAPVRPRPVLWGGTRADGTVVAPTEVTWLIEADMEQRGDVTALLCHDCLELLQRWLYVGIDGVPPNEGDRVRLTYGDGSTVDGTWRGVVERDDGQLHTHTRGHVRRDVLERTDVR